MGRPVLGGVNLAITYGMGLIIGALVIAALYMAACARNCAPVWAAECVSFPVRRSNRPAHAGRSPGGEQVIYETSYTAIGVFAFFVAVVLGISFYLGREGQIGQRLLRRARPDSTGSSTASPSPAIISRPRRSSASAG